MARGIIWNMNDVNNGVDEEFSFVLSSYAKTYASERFLEGKRVTIVYRVYSMWSLNFVVFNKISPALLSLKGSVDNLLSV